MTREIRDSVLLMCGAFAAGLLFFDEKLSLSGDNAEFVILGRALAAGKGLVYMNIPDLPPGTKYPPGFIAILALFDLAVPDSIVAMKVVALLAFVFSIPLIYLLLIRHTTRKVTLYVCGFCVLSPTLLEFSSQVMSEIPFLLVSFVTLLLLDRRRPGATGILPTLLVMMAAYYIRTVGIALVASVLLILLLKKEYRLCGLVAAGAILIALPWSLHSQSSGGSPYLRQFLSVDPYRPDSGVLGLGTLIERIVENLGSYSFKMIPSIVLPVPFLSIPRLTDYPPTLFILAAIPSVLVLYFVVAGFWTKGVSTPRVFLLVYSSTLLLWPSIWADFRFLIPIVPLLYLAVIWSVLDIGSRVGNWRKVWRKLCFAAAFVIFTSSVIGSADLYSRKGWYPPNWDAYFKAGLWIRDHTTSDVVVACRKGYLMHLVSGRMTTGYKWEEPDKVMAGFEKDGVDLVVLDELPFNSTPRYLVPAINANRRRFRIAHQVPNHDTFVLVFDRDQQIPNPQGSE
jgi:hypothetical protein